MTATFPSQRQPMSGGSQDYYHSYRSTRDDRNLPSIRDVVGDELDRRQNNPNTTREARGSFCPLPPYSSRTNDHRGPTLPPIIESGNSLSRPAGYTVQGWHPNVVSQSQRRHSTSSHRDRVHEEPGHIYGVLRSSPTPAGALIHAAPPAERPHGILRQSSTSHTYDQDPERRHRCDYCGKGFDRPSSLEVHLRTHTGSQPFACEWPGCNRTFSVRSNMLRHLRSHEKNAGSSKRRDSFTDDYYESDPREDFSSSRHFPPSAYPPSSHYYSSSRHK